MERSSSILKLSAFFGNGGTSEPLVSNGVPNLVLGIDGTTQCSAQPPEMPSTNIVHSNSLIAVGESIFSFGGKVPLIMSGVTETLNTTLPPTNGHKLKISDTDVIQ